MSKMDPYKVIIMPWITEKSLEARRIANPDEGFFQNNNRLEFIVNEKATKLDVKEAVERLFDTKVAKVNIRISKHGKHASVKMAEGYDADVVAQNLSAF